VGGTEKRRVKNEAVLTYLAKLAAIRHVAARLQPHFGKIGDNALLLTSLGNVFAVRRYKKGGNPG